MCEIAKYLCYFSKYLSIIAEQSGVDPGECQERSGYYMISEQSVNTLKLSHLDHFIGFLLVASLGLRADQSCSRTNILMRPSRLAINYLVDRWTD